MKISLSLILDELQLEASTHIGGERPVFSSVEMYVVGDTYDADTLLICPLSEVIGPARKDGQYFICVRDRIKDDKENDRSLKGITIIERNIDVRALFNLVQRIFVKINNWIFEMEKSTARRAGLQELLNLSEPIFRSFITIQDSTFKLMAYTKNITTTDVVMNRLVQYGYHPTETMELLQRHRRIEQFRTQTEVIVSRDKATSEYDVVKKTFHISESNFLMIVMVCNGREASDAVVELFTTLVEYIQKYVDLEKAQAGNIGGARILVSDVLGRNVRSKEETRIRATYCGYPFESDFRLFIFAFEDEQNVPTQRIAKSLKEIYEEGIIFTHNKYILLLKSSHSDIGSFCTEIANRIDYASFKCGVSDRFKCLWELPDAYEQSLIAIEVSSRLKNPVAHSASENTSFCFFSDNIVYHLISAGYKESPGVYENSFFTNAIAILREYDAQHHTETMKILRLYLENERRATVVANILHMHRNTVLYHVEKAVNLLGISFDEPESRLRLLLAFKADDFEKL